MTSQPHIHYDLFCYEAFAEESKRLVFYAAKEGLKIGYTPQTIQEAGHTEPPATVISVRTQSIIPVAWGKQLDGLLTRSTGYDHLTDYRRQIGDAATGLQMGYLPLYCAQAVAEQAMLLWMALLRRLPMQLKQFQSFSRDHLTGYENKGRRMAVFGVGNIGHRVCHLATLLGMQVVGVDPVRRHSDVVYMSPDDALAEADIIVCAMNLTQENHGYFTLRRLQQTRKSPLLINIARGEFTPAAVLRKALEDGHLSGIGLDVYNDETTLAQSLRSGTKDLLTQDNLDMLWLHKQPQCICTPHNAFNTAEAVERKSEQTIRSMQHYRREGAFLWPLPE